MGDRRGPLKVGQRVEFAMIINISCSSGKLRGPLDVVQHMGFTIYYSHFPILGRGPRTTPCRANREICNIFAGFSDPQASSEDHSMLCSAWNLQYIINIFLSLEEVWGPLDVDPTGEFAIAYQHFLLLGGAPMTTRRRATHGIYNTLLTFPCSRGKSEHRSMSIKPLILQ